MRYQWVERNPIKLVRQSAKRERTPDILELAELQLLLSKLAVRERTLALLDAATGLRVSELLALRWSDVDFENLELRVTRSIWHQVVGNCKTEASAKPVPMDSYMAEDLLSWRRQSTYSSNDDYVFASETMRGKQPYWPDNLMKRHIKPVAKASGIHKKIGARTRDLCRDSTEANGNLLKPIVTDGFFWRSEVPLATLIGPLLDPRPLPCKPLPKLLGNCTEDDQAEVV
jgi:integrase